MNLAPKSLDAFDLVHDQITEQIFLNRNLQIKLKLISFIRPRPVTKPGFDS